jgi:hypothetical protein
MTHLATTMALRSFLSDDPQAPVRMLPIAEVDQEFIVQCRAVGWLIVYKSCPDWITLTQRGLDACRALALV